VATTAAALGWQFMPWQRYVAAVTGEVDPVTGEFAHPVVVLTVQRQAGKTVLVGSNNVHRCLTTLDRECWYTAQTRTDARKNFMKLIRRIRRSPLRPPFCKIRESNGSESIEFPSGSSYGLFAPTDEALHGTANGIVNIDEAWAFDTIEGAAMLQAIMPTFATVDGQLWIFSAAGSARSTWLRELVDAGRLAAAADAGPPPAGSMAYFEFGIPDDVDPGDIDAVIAHHPANGYTLRRDAVVAAAGLMSPDEFGRAYGNRWAPTGAPAAIPELVWRMAGEPGIPLPGPGVLALAFEVGQDGRDAAIVAAWRDGDGVARVELAEHREGTSWLVPRLVELVETYDPVAVRYDRMGPAVAVGDEAIRAGVDATAVTTDEITGACAGMLAGLAARSIRYRPHPALHAAAVAVSTRPVGDRWVWARRTSGVSVAAFIAATVAVWAADHAAPHAPFTIG
jgi:hypothetical protein